MKTVMTIAYDPKPSESQSTENRNISPNLREITDENTNDDESEEEAAKLFDTDGDWIRMWKSMEENY